MKSQYDLEERLVSFAGNSILFGRSIVSDYEGNHLKGQMIRSSTSAALNYGEAQGTVTVKDAIHKNSIVLKELKETKVTLKILQYIKYGNEKQRSYLLKECDELSAILATIIKNKKKKL